MAFTPKQRKPGDLIKSGEWNEVTDEVQRLEKEKVGAPEFRAEGGKAFVAGGEVHVNGENGIHLQAKNQWIIFSSGQSRMTYWPSGDLGVPGKLEVRGKPGRQRCQALLDSASRAPGSSARPRLPGRAPGRGLLSR